MKVAFILQPWETIDTPFVGGVALPTVAYHLGRSLARAGNQVLIYAKRGPGQAAIETDTAGIEYRRFALPLEEPFWSGCRRLEDVLDWGNRRRPLVTSPRFFCGLARRIACDLRQQACDLVHLFTYPQLATPIRRANPTLKIVLHMECEFLVRFDHARLSEQLRAVDRILGCSDFITEGVRRRFPFLAERCHTVFNGVDLEAFAPALPGVLRDTGEPAEKRLLYVGRISPEKGVHVLLEAFSEVLDQHPDARLDLVGPVGLFPERLLPAVGDDRMASELAPFYGKGFGARLFRQWRRRQRLEAALWERLAKTARGRVVFHGFTPPAGLRTWYQRADVLVFPSVCNEAFGIPLIEAMSSGLAVVAARTGGIPEIVEDTRCGLLVRRGDRASLAEAICHLLGDRRRRLEMGAEGRRRAVERFGWERIHSTLKKAYGR
ncbi:MAG: glycosyltransferase family 4 protein [Thermoanaerobaculia bacterium]